MTWNRLVVERERKADGSGVEFIARVLHVVSITTGHGLHPARMR
jgi:hypothetical protein